MKKLLMVGDFPEEQVNYYRRWLPDYEIINCKNEDVHKIKGMEFDFVWIEEYYKEINNEN